MLKYSMAIHIKLVGVWDTVGDLGVPWLTFEGSALVAGAVHEHRAAPADRTSAFMRSPSTSTGRHFCRRCGR